MTGVEGSMIHDINICYTARADYASGSVSGVLGARMTPVVCDSRSLATVPQLVSKLKSGWLC